MGTLKKVIKISIWHCLKKYEQICIKIEDLVRSTSNNLKDDDEKYMKSNFSTDDDLPLEKTLNFMT